jgi:hypothetical protein
MSYGLLSESKVADAALVLLAALGTGFGGVRRGVDAKTTSKRGTLTKVVMFIVMRKTELRSGH